MPRLAGALGPTVTSGPASAAISDLDVANSLLPVWPDLCKPLIRVQNAASLTDDSFFVNQNNTQAPSSGAFTGDLVNLRAGPWRLVVSLQSQSDFVSAPAAGVPPLLTKLQLVDNLTTPLQLIVHPYNTQLQSDVMAFVILVAQDGWKLRLSQDATGAAQNTYASASCVGARAI